MKISVLAWVRILTYITASGGALVAALSLAFPNEAARIAAVGAVILFGSGLVLSVISNENKPATSIVAGATIVPAGTNFTTSATPVLGINAHAVAPPGTTAVQGKAS